MLKSSNGKSRQSGRRSVNDKVYDEAWDEVWDPRKGRAFHQPPRIVKSRTRTTTRTRTKPRKGRTKPRKGRAFPQPSVSHGPRTLPVLQAPQGTGLPAAFSLSRPTYSASPAAPIHATAHFIAFFVAHFVVYASSPDFVETALGQPYLNTKGAFMPALYLIPGFSAHPDHIQTHTIFPHKPGSAK
jgi:hypothetical protein